MKRDKPHKTSLSHKIHAHLHSTRHHPIASDASSLTTLLDAKAKISASDLFNDPSYDLDLRSAQYKIANGLNKVENILITIYNHHISTHKNDQLDIAAYRKQVHELSQGFDDDYYLELMYILLKKMKELMGRYRRKLFEVQIIEEIRARDSALHMRRSLSIEKSVPRGVKRHEVRAQMRRMMTIEDNTDKKRRDQLRKAARVAIFELRNIKRTLIRSSKDIEEIFITPKKTFNRFSIEHCQREEFVNTLVNDPFVQFLLRSSNDPKFEVAISEIEEDKDKNLSQMSDFLYFLNQDDNIYLDSLGFDYTSSLSPSMMKSVKDKQVKVNVDIDELVKFIDGGGEEEKKKPKKKRKKNAKKISESSNGNYLPINSNSNAKDDCFDNFQASLSHISRYSYEVQKIKTCFSKEWLCAIKALYD